MQLSDYQRDILIRTALGEARGEGVDGMADVIQTIFNRANSGQFPTDPAAVALQNKQYSTWNSGAGGNNPQQFSRNSAIYKKAEQALDMVLGGRPDYTGGALYYHTPSVNPTWARNVDQYGTIERNGHIFYPNRPVPRTDIPNTVASLTDTVPPRTSPVPVTMTPDLALMRNPQMSASARAAQVTPSPNVPLPRPRPSAPDIVSQTMTRLQTPARQPNATRAGDIGLTRPNAVTPRLTDDGSDIYSYHIPDITHTAVVGGLGSLTPGVGAAPRPAQQSPQLAATRARDQQLQAALNARYPTRLPDLPPSTIGQPPTTRIVQSVPVNMPPTAREIASAPGVTVATIPTVQPVRPIGSSVSNIQQQRLEQAALRTPIREARLTPQGPLVPNTLGAALNQPPIQIVGNPMAPRTAMAPMPRPATMRPLAPVRPAPLPMARVNAPIAPLRIVVQGGTYAPLPQMSAAQKYAALTAAARGGPSLEDRITGRAYSNDSTPQSLVG